MSENMNLYEKVRSVPKEALKPINGGRLKGMSDINPMWRLKMLTELFGICGIGWKIEITDKRLENGSDNEIVCFVDINLYIKSDGEWSAPIPGMGGSSFVTKEARGLYTSDECFKMAYTDAISVACKSLGFAADVYFANDRTKYTKQEDEEKRDIPPDSPPEMDPDLAAIEEASRKNTAVQMEISEGQAKMLYAKGSQAGLSEDKEKFYVQVSEFLGYAIQDLKSVRKADVSRLALHLEKQKKIAS